MSKSSTLLRISVALALLSSTLILLAYAVGFLPDEEKAERNARASIAESLAIQIISQTSRNDLKGLQQTIDVVVSRNQTILSIGLRRANGVVFAQAGNHKKNWTPVKKGVSTETHIYVPINNGTVFWGALEISFVPLEHAVTLFGIPIVIAILAGFLGISGLVGNYFVLKRSLRELDPSRVVPDRVQKAFDTLAEGILILDDRGLVLLSNTALAKEVNEDAKILIGTKAADFPWHQRNTTQSEFPWILALRDATPVVGASLAMKTHKGNIRQFTVNATRISDDKGAVTGVIVTFDDVTELELKNGELNQLVQQLKEKEVEVNLKNRELHHLATRDPLTNCLNRRAFFDAFQRGIDNARKNNMPVYCMMMDLDHFKNVNDQYGHAVGDEVIMLMGDILKSACRETDLAGRYGGEEFCIALFGLNEEYCHQVAERIRLAVTARAKEIKVLERSITTSIGIVQMGGGVFDPNELLDLADKALYAAKTSGRNRTVNWKDLNEDGKLEEASESSEVVSVTDVTVPTADKGPFKERQSEVLGENEQAQPQRPAMPFIKRADGTSVETLFLDRLKHSMARADRNDNVVALLFIKVSPEQYIEDERADEIGQKLNETMRSRMANLLRKSDSVSPLSDLENTEAVTILSQDIFAVQITDISSIDPVIWIIKRLINSTSEKITINEQNVRANCHFGISLYPGDGDEAAKLFERARAAASYAREHLGPNSHFFCSKKMNEHVNRQLAIERGLRDGLANGELVLKYQPIMDLRTGRVTGLETLLRCPDENLRDVPTSMLISIAEQSGLIAQIGEWTITQAIAQFQFWAEEGIDLEKIAVNLSNVQLANPGTSKRLIDIMNKMDFDPRNIQLEIQESNLNENFTHARKCLLQLQEAGAQLALDDFGSGNSSLTNVTRLGLNCIKIDQGCIQDIVHQNSDVSLIAAIIAMSHELGLTVIAEGVETQIQMDRLVELNCDYVQGHLISTPMEASRIIDWLKLFTKKNSKKWKNPSLGKKLEM